jgi:prefoldin subunit 5
MSKARTQLEDNREHPISDAYYNETEVDALILTLNNKINALETEIENLESSINTRLDAMFDYDPSTNALIIDARN